jgi:hypothetical protein
MNGETTTAKNWLLLAAAVGFAILLLEIAVRAWYASTGHTPPHPDPSLRAEWEWARAHLEAARATLPGSADFDPAVGWLPDRNVERWLAQKSLGMTRPGPFREVRDSGKDRVPRLLVVGDSFTFGIYVGNEQAYPNVLQRDHMPDWEVLNFGVPGFGADQMVLLYEGLGARYSPDIVVLAFYTGGEERATRRFAYYAKPYFDLVDGRLVLQGVPVVPPELLYGEYQHGERRVAPFPYSYLYGAVATSIARLREQPIVDASSEQWQLIAAIFARFRDDAVARGARPMLLVIPTNEDVESGAPRNRIGALAVAAARELGMPALSLRDPFAAADAEHPEDPLFRPEAEGGHFTPRGHALTAELLDRALRDSALLPAVAAPSAQPENVLHVE